MTKIARIGLRERHILRTGDAAGSDEAFRKGTTRRIVYCVNHFWFGDRKLIYPEDTCWSEANQMLTEIMDSSHYSNVVKNQYVHSLHMRNSFQVLGVRHDNPSSLLICWTKDSKAVGGTATAIKIAEKNGIDVFNLGDSKVAHECRKAIKDDRFPFINAN